MKSYWVWRSKLGTPIFGEFLPFFSADPLKLCQVGWGALAHGYFQVFPEMFDQVRVRTLAGLLKDVHKLFLKLLLGCFGCALGLCPSASFSHLHRGTLELCQSDHWILGRLPAQGPSPPDWSVWPGDYPGWSKPLPFKNNGGYCSREPSMLQTFFFYPSPDPQSCLDSFQFMAWFLLWHALWTAGPYKDRCVPFKIMSYQLNLPQKLSWFQPILPLSDG